MGYSMDMMTRELTAKPLALVSSKEIISANLSEEEEIYKENIIDHYKNPRNKLELLDYTFKERGFNSLCGDEIILYLKVAGEMIIDVSFQGDGCAISQASASLLTVEIKGKSLSKIKQFNEDKILSLLGIPISHTRMRCALLSINTLQKALGGSFEEKVSKDKIPGEGK